MGTFLQSLLIICYAGIAVIDVMAYLPTLRDLYSHNKPSGNMMSYVLWTYTTGVSFLYSLFVLDDMLFRVVSGTLFFFNFVVLMLLLRLRTIQPKKSAG